MWTYYCKLKSTEFYALFLVISHFALKGEKGHIFLKIVFTANFYFYFLFFKVYFTDYAITVVPVFLPLYSPPPAFPHPISSCPWVVHISSLASPLPILFLTSPCLFCTYHSCFLFPVPLPLYHPHRLPADNPPCDLHFSDSVPVLVVCLVCYCFCF